jgi:hypothetical protein
MEILEVNPSRLLIYSNTMSFQCNKHSYASFVSDNTIMRCTEMNHRI